MSVLIKDINVEMFQFGVNAGHGQLYGLWKS